MLFRYSRFAFLFRAAAGKLLNTPGTEKSYKATAACLGKGKTGGNSMMERAVVRCVPSESKLCISFNLEGSQKCMQRDQNELLGRVLARIATNAQKGRTKAKKSKKNRTEEAAAVVPLVQLSYGDKVVAENVINTDAWQDGAVLQVGDVKYLVERNPPTFKDMELPGYIMAGFPVCPKLQIEFGELEQSDFQWYKQAMGSASADGAVESCWVEAGNERVFIPTNSDIGLKLKLKCRPGNNQRYGVARELEVNCTVEAGPGTCAFDNRHLYTKKVTDESMIRVVSYNILADTYAQTDYSKNVLFPYCAPYALQIDYRQNLIKKELTGYNADIICLQEVDKTVFSDSLSPVLDVFGLEGVYRLKEKQHEGVSTFFRRSKFSLLSQHDIIFTEALLSDPLHKDLLENLCLYPAAKEKFLQRSSVLQVCVLQSTKDPSRKICVANTHLYFHPKGANIRLLQIAVALSHIRHVACDMYPAIPVIFCGDFNSTPSTGLYSFMKSGTISEDHEDWVSNGEEEQCNMSLTHPLKLQSACGEPAYTNYVGGFHGCLDYIFIDSTRFEVEQVIPMPSHEEVTTHHALPSVSYPSDHIALVCDTKWK